jgi:hypothetical protein
MSDHRFVCLFIKKKDITPNTQGSRIVMMLLIVIALAVLPTLIGDVSDTIQRRRGTLFGFFSITCF